MGEGERGVWGQGGGKGECELLRGIAARGEDENGAEVCAEGFGDHAGPEAGDAAGSGLGKGEEVDICEGDWAILVGDEDGVATDAAEPVDHVVRIGNAAAEEEQLGGGGSEGHRELVVHAADGIGEHLVLVHNEEAGAIATQEAAFLGLESGDDDAGIEMQGEVASGDADIPTAAAPLGEFVIGEGASGYGVNGLAAKGGLEELEDEGLAGAGGGIDNHVAALAQRMDGFMLP